MRWTTIDDIGTALNAGRLWLLSGPKDSDRHIAIADSEAEARAQFPRVNDRWACKRADPEEEMGRYR